MFRQTKGRETVTSTPEILKGDLFTKKDTGAGWEPGGKKCRRKERVNHVSIS